MIYSSHNKFFNKVCKSIFLNIIKSSTTMCFVNIFRSHLCVIAREETIFIIDVEWITVLNISLNKYRGYYNKEYSNTCKKLWKRVFCLSKIDKVKYRHHNNHDYAV